ncbi:hypothetical protein FRIG_03810 [Frigoribacterium faeni]|uniref:hypothetical protein n=1 Tax=Frigoribacterium faeni TaxID=145483 RepID=UPI001FAE448D|nr:hypothetical protein [Frigoribacterium faeni]MCJ0700267.1 hypothetical protein [Frigoribacterium faeni]
MNLSSDHMNPAGRLFLFLKTANDTGRDQTAAFMADYFETDPYSPTFFTGLGMVGRLPDEVFQAIEGLPSEAFRWMPKERLTRALPNATRALVSAGKNFQSQNREWTQLLSAQDLHDVELCSNFLAGGWALSDPAEATSTLKQAGQLVDELTVLLEEDSSISSELRVALVNMALDLRRAISLSRVAGPEAAGAERDRIYGMITSHPEMKSELRKTPKIGHKVLEIMSALNIVLSAFNGTMVAYGHLDERFFEVQAAPEAQTPELQKRTVEGLPGPGTVSTEPATTDPPK